MLNHRNLLESTNNHFIRTKGWLPPINFLRKQLKKTLSLYQVQCGYKVGQNNKELTLKEKLTALSEEKSPTGHDLKKLSNNVYVVLGFVDDDVVEKQRKQQMFIGTTEIHPIQKNLTEIWLSEKGKSGTLTFYTTKITTPEATKPLTQNVYNQIASNTTIKELIKGAEYIQKFNDKTSDDNWEIYVLLYEALIQTLQRSAQGEDYIRTLWIHVK